MKSRWEEMEECVWTPELEGCSGGGKKKKVWIRVS